MDLIEKLEEEGKIIVIRPLKPVDVSRMEKDTAKLAALYQEGYEIALNI
jgi:predicted patatin/cPLA2 family phospholipase